MLLRLPKLFKIVNNIEQHCHTQFSLNPICSMLLATMKNMGSSTLFNSVILQTYNFWPWRETLGHIAALRPLMLNCTYFQPGKRSMLNHTKWPHFKLKYKQNERSSGVNSNFYVAKCHTYCPFRVNYRCTISKLVGGHDCEIMLSIGKWACSKLSISSLATVGGTNLVVKVTFVRCVFAGLPPEICSRVFRSFWWNWGRKTTRWRCIWKLRRRLGKQVISTSPFWDYPRPQPYYSRNSVLRDKRLNIGHTNFKWKTVRIILVFIQITGSHKECTFAIWDICASPSTTRSRTTVLKCAHSLNSAFEPRKLVRCPRKSRAAVCACARGIFGERYHWSLVV